MAALATALAVAAAGAGTAQAEHLTPAQLAGQRVVAGYPGLAPPRDLGRRIRRGRVGAVILFSRNFESRRQLRRTIARLQAVPRPPALDEPLLVMVDQEGGPVRRIPGSPRRSAAAVGADGRTATARRSGRRAARNLTSVGVNVNLAPVADVARRGSAMERERRAYGRRPRKVARLAGAFARGLQAGGALATAKHFPGFGAASANTDDRRVTINVPRKRLRAVDERPFRALFRRGVRLVMLSTATYTALDRRPAALSPRVARRELRGRVGFDGVSMADALGTPGTAAFGSAERVGIRAARAGVDLLTYADYGTGRSAARALAGAIRRGRVPRGRAQASVERVLELRRGLR